MKVLYPEGTVRLYCSSIESSGTSQLLQALVSPLSGDEGKSVLVDKDVLYIPSRQPEA